MEKPYYIDDWLWNVLSESQRITAINRETTPSLQRINGKKRYQSKRDRDQQAATKIRNAYNRYLKAKDLLDDLDLSDSIRSEIWDNLTEIQRLARRFGDIIPNEDMSEHEVHFTNAKGSNR